MVAEGRFPWRLILTVVIWVALLVDGCWRVQRAERQLGELQEQLKRIEEKCGR